MNRSTAHPLISPFVALTLAGSMFALSFAAAVPAGAPAAPSLEVKIGDLDLDNPAGVTKLYKRLQIAAQKVCGPSDVTGTRLGLRDQKACVTAAVDGAVRQLNRPALTAFHESHAAKRETEKT
jgi:UrcA family protein